MYKLKELPKDLICYIYTFDPTFRNLYNKVINEITRLPKLCGIYEDEKDIKNITTEFVFSKTYNRKHHIYCTYQCYRNMLSFWSKHKYSEERKLYSKDYNIYCTPHNYICQEVYNYNDTLFSNVITTNNYNSCL